MKKTTKKLLSGIILAGLALPAGAFATEADLMKRIDDLEAKLKKVEDKSLGKWLTIGGDYRFRYDYLQGKVPNYMQFTPNTLGWIMSNGTVGAPDMGQEHKVRNTDLYTNRFGLDLKAKVVQDVSFTARLLMYKAAGAQDDAAVAGGFFGDRNGLFDGTIGHVPGDNKLGVDRVYATWNNIAEQPIWFSIGRRPSTGGIPSHLKQNQERPGNAGVPQILVDYAFDGVTLGYAPDIDALPGAYAKLCYGRGFQTGFEASNAPNGLRNTDMIGVNLVPYETDPFRLELQYNRGMNIFNQPIMLTGPNAGTGPSINIGNIDWFSVDALGVIKNVGPGSLNWFIDGAMSVTRPNNNTVNGAFGLPDSSTGFTDIGLMYTGQREQKNGWAVYVGGRYDIESTRTKIGFEYNHGNRDWITFSPAADDMWTSKVGTRGDVYEGYIIQELPLAPISSYVSKAFFKVGYQYYKFDYTGSNNWVGGSTRMSQVSMAPQMFTPIENAQDLYATFEVKF